MTGNIWLIGGTQESAAIARELVQQQIPCTVSVTTAAARSLYPQDSNLQIWVGCLDAHSLPQFLSQQQVVAILDASHPFAVEISEQAIAVAAKFHIPYLRYERPELDQIGGERGKEEGGEGEAGEAGEAGEENSPSRIANLNAKSLSPSTFCLESFTALLAGEYLLGQRVLLAIGYRPLVLFQPWQDRATLFARILPSMPALQAALAAGFTSDRLVALRPPVSAVVERALWQQWQISMVVTKASGTPGGEDIKRQVAAEMGVQLVVIARPQVVYPQQTSDLRTVIEFCHHWA
jgi:precorrin-6A/cobalt-precorrin-6A reductase